MSVIRKVQQFFSNHCETRENHFDPMLRTHYFKVTASSALKSIQEQLNSLPGHTVTSVSSEHGEISLQITSPRKAFVVVTVISVRPLETAIDFSVTSESLISFGYSRAVVLNLYNVLNKNFIHIGNGITANNK